MDSDTETPVNLGNADERIINELAEEIVNLTGSDSGITCEELPPQDPKVRRPDISKARDRLDWTPSVQFRDGLERSIE